MLAESPVAIIGAGIAGAACARTLVNHGIPVRVFDKGRAPGGRMSTRRHGADTFDHGCAYFVARGSAFQTALEPLIARGAVAELNGLQILQAGGAPPTPLNTTVPCYVGVPGNSAVGRALLGDVDVSPRVTVASVRQRAGRWLLHDEDEQPLGEFDTVVIAVPAPQVAGMVGDGFPHAEKALEARYAPCWSVMAAYDQPLDSSIDLAVVDGSDIGWVAREQARPGRPPGVRWVFHANDEWSHRHLEHSPEDVARALHVTFLDLVARAPREPTFLTAHRWRYAFCSHPLRAGCFFDVTTRGGLCGDWCSGGSVEGAWTSGVALGDAIAATDG